MEYAFSVVALLIALIALVISGFAWRNARKSAEATVGSARALERRVELDDPEIAKNAREGLQANVVVRDWSNRDGVHVQNRGTGIARDMTVFVAGTVEGEVTRSAPINLPGGTDAFVHRFVDATMSKLPRWENGEGTLPAQVGGTARVFIAWTNDDGSKGDSGWTYQPRE